MAADLIRRLREYFLPFIEDETRGSLPTPTPPRARADRPWREEQYAASLEWFQTEILSKMRSAGVVISEPVISGLDE